jgi:thiosulfate/3-mercaptopyruvate sulfurtransferase
MTEIKNRGYSKPEILLSTDDLNSILKDPMIRIVESNEDQLLFSSGHISGAVEIDWVRDLNQPVIRDYLDIYNFNKLLSRCGIDKDTTVIFYGDKNNWWACYAFWIFQLFGHTNAKILDGGRLKWLEEKKPLTKERVEHEKTNYEAPLRDDKTYRALRDDVFSHLEINGKLIDVRSPDEFSGAKLHMEGYPNEGALRGGHIPGAKSVPWARAVNSDGTFKTAEELLHIYSEEAEISQYENVITYCRIGERSSHTWFVLKYLLGYANVRNYDGSWTEWGNLVGAPIEK